MTDQWFEKSFGEEYLKLYSHRDDTEAGRVVDLILNKTGLATDAIILDAPCGAGRHLKAFRNRGYSAVGFDLSSVLLREARAVNGVPVVICRADLRAIPFRAAQFDLVANLFSSLGYFATDAENYSILESLVSLCKRDGWIVVDFMNGDYVRQNLNPESSRVTADGIKVKDRRWIAGDPARVNKETEVTFPGGRTKTLYESVRLFRPDELRQALQRMGVEISAEFGDYSGSEFTADSSRIILIGRRT